jgi:hypothetical protein
MSPMACMVFTGGKEFLATSKWLNTLYAPTEQAFRRQKFPPKCQPLLTNQHGVISCNS